MSYQELNDQLLNNLLKHTVFKGWKEEDSVYSALEFIINGRCNLACQYCYIARYHDQMYPDEMHADPQKILDNVAMVCDWLKENNYQPRIEYFGGEPLVQDIGIKALDLIIDKLKGWYKGEIVIPTNYSFILSKGYREKVEMLLKKSQENNCPISLSASFDGKYCEANRPFLYQVKSHEMSASKIWKWEYNDLQSLRDDKFYDDVFAFAKEHKFGFHPMIYSNTVANWKQNFLWFQEQFKKHDIPWNNIYLLEVRNAEWTNEQSREFGDFIEFLIEWTWNMVGKNFDRYMEFLHKGRGYNLLTSPITRIGRGIGCSIQSMVYLRVADLSLVPCHRTSYEPLIYGKFKVEDGKIVGVEAKNVEMAIAVNSMSANNFPMCETCVIKNVCSHGCLGAQLETTGDMFTPIPSVCKMEHEKIWAMIRAYKKIGIYGKWYDKLMPDKAEAFRLMDEIMEVTQK